MQYELTAMSKNSSNVRAKVILQVEAGSLDEATSILHGALPGADWSTWQSNFGVVELRAREDAPTP